MNLTLFTKDVDVLETQEEFWRLCGVRFEIDEYVLNPPRGTNRGANLRKHVPRDVAVATTFEEDEERVFEDIYLVYCRRGRVFVYKAF